MEQWTIYRRAHMAEKRPYVLGELEMRPWVSGDTGFGVSDMDRDAGSPKVGDMIARNPRNYDHQWLIAAKDFADHYEAV